MDDFVFTFDVNPFMAAMDQISKGFETLKESVQGFSQTTEGKSNETIQKTNEVIKKGNDKLKKGMEVSVSNFADNSKKMLNSLIKRVAALGTAYLSIRKVLQYIPEIGRAFRHAGDIALRSLLWPLREELIPLLNKMLAWVRDHRVMFVRWGAVIANAFRSVFTIVKGIIGVVKTLVDSFMSRFELIFGKTTNRLSDVMNIIMFKFTVMIEYLLAVLNPVAEKIGTMVAGIAGLFKEFFIGFKDAAGDLSPYLSDIANSLSRIWTSITGINDSTGILGKTFRTLGQILGTVLHPILAIIGQTIDTLASGIEGIISAVQVFKAWKRDDKDEIRRLMNEREVMSKEFEARMKQRWGNAWENIKEGVKGIGETWTKPKENTEIIKEPVRTSMNTESKTIRLEAKIDMGRTEININTEGDAQKIGEQFAMSMNQTLNQQLRKMLQDSNLGVAGA